MEGLGVNAQFDQRRVRVLAEVIVEASYDFSCERVPVNELKRTLDTPV